jgi:hypothetical protein
LALSAALRFAHHRKQQSGGDIRGAFPLLAILYLAKKHRNTLATPFPFRVDRSQKALLTRLLPLRYSGLMSPKAKELHIRGMGKISIRSI